MFFDLLSTRLSTLEPQKRFRGKQPQAELKKKGVLMKKKHVLDILKRTSRSLSWLLVAILLIPPSVKRLIWPTLISRRFVTH